MWNALIWKTGAPLWKKNIEEELHIHKSQGLIIAVAMATLAYSDEDKLAELHDHAPMYSAHCQIKSLSIFKMYHHNLCVFRLHKKTIE